MAIGVYKRTPKMKTGLHMKGRVAWNKGKKLTKEEILEQSGENSSRWKGGVSLGKNKVKYNKEYGARYKKRIRKEVVDFLGGKCLRCGFDDIRALQIDHIHGNGHKERQEKRFKGFGKIYYRFVIESVKNNEDKYQLLCANCNWIKRVENKELSGNFKTLEI